MPPKKKLTWKDNDIGRALVEPVGKAGNRINPVFNGVNSVVKGINALPGPNLPVPPRNPIPPIAMAKGGVVKKSDLPKLSKGYKWKKR